MFKTYLKSHRLLSRRSRTLIIVGGVSVVLFQGYMYTAVQHRAIFIESLRNDDSRVPRKTLPEVTDSLKENIQKNPSVSTVKKQLKQIDEMQLSPDVRFFATAISQLTARQKTFEARKTIKIMKEEWNIKPNQFCYYPLLHYYAKTGQKQQIASILKKEYSENNLAVDQHTLSALIAGHAINGEKELVNRYIQQLREKKQPWDSNIHKVVASGLFQTRQMEEGMKEVEKIQEKHVPVSDMFDKALSIFLKDGKLEEARKLFNSMKASTSPLLSVTIASYCSMITAYIKTGDLEAVNRLQEEMKEKNFETDKAIYTSIIVGNILQYQFDFAKELYDKLKSAGSVDSRVYDSMIRAYVQVDRIVEAFLLLKEAIDGNFLLSRSTYSTLIQYLCKSSRPSSEKNVLVNQLISQMEAAGLKPYQLTPVENRLLHSN